MTETWRKPCSGWCHDQAATQREQYRAELARQRREIDATHVIGSRLRLMCLPGIRRKTVRLDDLRALIAEIDAQAAKAGQECVCAPPCQSCGSIFPEHACGGAS